MLYIESWTCCTHVHLYLLLKCDMCYISRTGRAVPMFTGCYADARFSLSPRLLCISLPPPRVVAGVLQSRRFFFLSLFLRSRHADHAVALLLVLSLLRQRTLVHIIALIIFVFLCRHRISGRTIVLIFIISLTTTAC